MLRYKFNILEALKDAGYSSYQIRKTRMFSEGTLTKFRNEEPVSAIELDKLCKALGLQPGDILEYIPDPEQTD